MISTSLSRWALLCFLLPLSLNPLWGQDGFRVQIEEQPPVISQDTVKRLLQADEIAEKFVQRWHETLDLNELQDEFFFQDAATWRAFVREGTRYSEIKIFRGCNSREIELNSFSIIKRAMLSIATFEALQEEYDVYNFGTSTDIKHYSDDLISQAIKMQRLFEQEEELRSRIEEKPEIKSEAFVCDEFLQKFLTELTAGTEEFSALLRQHLPKTIFTSEQYQKHLNAVAEAENFADPDDESDFEDFVLARNNDEENIDVQNEKPKGEKVAIKTVRVQKGIFTFVFIEENAKLKILFALPTRQV